MYDSGDVTCEEDQLILDEAPLVYYYLKSDYWKEPRNNQGKDYVPCPLEGGYIMKYRYDVVYYRFGRFISARENITLKQVLI